jgi:hypothetical protein
MATNSYPHDRCGNSLKLGDMVYSLEHKLAMTVVDVQPALGLDDARGGRLPTTGQIVFQALKPIQFGVDTTYLNEFLALKKPEPEDLPLNLVKMPEVAQ